MEDIYAVLYLHTLLSVITWIFLVMTQEDQNM